MTVIPETSNLFVVDIEYKVPMDQIETVIAPHMDFVRRAYDEGRFIASGAKQPRTGGVIVMMAESLEDARGYLAQDPFVTADVADYRYTEFKATNLHAALK